METIDYAEMLEIPVSTVSVTKRRKRNTAEKLKERVMRVVNGAKRKGKEGENGAEIAQNQGDFEPNSGQKWGDFDPKTGQKWGDFEPNSGQKWGNFEPNSGQNQGIFASNTAQNEGIFASNSAQNEGVFASKTARKQGKKPSKNGSEIVLVSEFAIACVLATLVFLTNVFVEGSAMNVFSKSLFDTPKIDKRTHEDFALSSVVSPFAEVDLMVSSSGVMSFTAKSTIYPIAEGVVSKVVTGESATVEVSHSDSFKSVIVGLRDVYLEEGEKAVSSLPLGYADGDIRVMLYEGGQLLNCFTLEENGIKWS